MTAFSGLRSVLLLLIASPAVEKSSSHGVELAGIHKYFFSKTANTGN